MKKKNIISLIISLIVVFNMVFCVSAIGLENNNADSSYGTSDLSAESVDTLSADTDGLNQGLDENPLGSVFTDGNAVGTVTTTDAMQAFLEEDLSKVTPGNTASTSKLDLKLILIIGSIVIIAAAIVVILITFNNRKNNNRKKKKSSTTGENPEYGSQSATPAPAVRIDIPVGVAGEIRYGYEFRGNASVQKSASVSSSPIDVPFEAAPASEPAVEIDNTRDIIMSIYKGEASADSFNGTVVPLTITNVYDLQVSQSIEPSFAIGTDVYSSDYILVNNKYLYLNFHVFSKSEFKLYPDIVAVQKCFNICNRTGAVASPSNQSIFDFEPAVFEIEGTNFVVSEKGKITVE